MITLQHVFRGRPRAACFLQAWSLGVRPLHCFSESPNPLSSPSGEVGRGGLQAPQLPLSVLPETFKEIRGWGLALVAFGDVCSAGEKMRFRSLPSHQSRRAGERKIDGVNKGASN